MRLGPSGQPLPHIVVRAMSSAAAEDEPKKKAYLLNHGSFNPAHKGHAGMMQKAKERLENAGWQVVAASLAPASDEYVRQKMRRLGRQPDREALALDLRAGTCEAVSADLEWLSCDRRGALYRSAPHMARTLLSEEQRGVVIFSVIGADVARKGIADFPHVVVARAGPELRFEIDEKRHHYVAEFGEDLGFHGFSSTAVREAMLAGNWDGVAEMCGGGAADLLQQRSESNPPAEATRGKKRPLHKED